MWCLEYRRMERSLTPTLSLASEGEGAGRSTCVSGIGLRLGVSLQLDPQAVMWVAEPYCSR
jgi:hypothetical protein